MNNRLTKQPHPGVELLRKLLGIKPKPLTWQEKRQQYHEYLKTEEWRVKADRCKRLANYRCNRCKTTAGPFHAHHRTYEHLYKERASELECLCVDCHEKEHGE